MRKIPQTFTIGSVGNGIFTHNLIKRTKNIVLYDKAFSFGGTLTYEIHKVRSMAFHHFSLINNLPDIDISIYDLRRVGKCPYSIVFPYYTVVLPMSDEMIFNFDIREYSIKTQIQNIPQLRNRGVLKREGTGEAFANLIKKYGNVK